ncbi:MAG: hypothetical protein ACRAVC_21320 [Trichormus sp.]
MFIDELSPIFKQLSQHPASFFGGFFSGLLRLNLADDPVKSWLDKQAGANSSMTQSHNGKATGPETIQIE